MALPIRPLLLPMLARLARNLPEVGRFVFEPKWDGFRCLALPQLRAPSKPSTKARSGLWPPTRGSYESPPVFPGRPKRRRVDGRAGPQPSIQPQREAGEARWQRLRALRTS
jgi:hypothetical protein